MKETIIFLVLISTTNAIETKDINEIIINQTISQVKAVGKNIVNMFENPPIIDQISNKRSYSDYQKENNKLKIQLKEKNINYEPLIKKELYRHQELNSKSIFPSREKLVIENKILRELAINNQIIKDINVKGNENKKKAKEELKKQMSL